MPVNDDPADLVEAVFHLMGRALPRDYAQPLQHALAAALPWLCRDAGVGILPLRLVPGSDTLALLSQRTRLILRVHANRMDALQALNGQVLEVAGHHLALGAVHLRTLQPHATLYAHRVAASSVDEVGFMQQVNDELARMAIAGERVCGKCQRLRLAEQDIPTFSLLVHGLAADQSLRLQQQGVGAHRLLGCGIFVPHKSAAAVGG